MKTLKRPALGKLLFLAVVSGVAACFFLARAQTVVSTTETDELNQAVTAYNQGSFTNAIQLINAIAPTNPDYPVAKCYDALCLYALSNKAGFLKEMDTPEVQEAVIPAAMREDMDFKQIDALFYYRKFEELPTQVADYQEVHSNSARLPAVLEYQMAALYERGMKKVYEACASGDDKVFQQRYNAGQTNLVDFLNLAVSLNQTNYQYLARRVLKTEIYAAQIALGDEASVTKEVPSADREGVTFLSVKLHERLQPKAVDDNLRRMTNFLNAFPQSTHRKRVMFDMAGISFSSGEALCRQADATEQAGDSQGAARQREAAAVIFNYTRRLQNQLTNDSPAGIEDADVFDRQDDLVYSYYLERNYEQTFGLASQLIQSSAPGDLHWMMGKNYRGITLLAGAAPDLVSAAAELDSVLTNDFSGRRGHDRQILVATGWRIYAAHRMGDDKKVTALVQWVQNSTCSKDQKAVFSNKYSSVLVSPNNKTK